MNKANKQCPKSITTSDYQVGDSTWIWDPSQLHSSSNLICFENFNDNLREHFDHEPQEPTISQTLKYKCVFFEKYTAKDQNTQFPSPPIEHV